MGVKPAVNSGLVEPESEQEIQDRQIPEGSLMDNGLLHVVQSGLWETMGEKWTWSLKAMNPEHVLQQGHHR